MKISVAFTLAGLLLGATAPTAMARSSDPVENTSSVFVSDIKPLKGNLIKVTLSDGYTAKIRPCVYEDGRRCYWQANKRGNGIGDSFLVLRGIVYRSAALNTF